MFDAARDGDELACFVVDKVCYYLAKAISLLAVTVDVDVYYIGGGVSKAGAILIDGIKKWNAIRFNRCNIGFQIWNKN